MFTRSMKRGTTTAATRRQKAHAPACWQDSVAASMRHRLRRMADDVDLLTKEQRVRVHAYLLTRDIVRAVCVASKQHDAVGRTCMCARS